MRGSKKILPIRRMSNFVILSYFFYDNFLILAVNIRYLLLSYRKTWCEYGIFSFKNSGLAIMMSPLYQGMTWR